MITGVPDSDARRHPEFSTPASEISPVPLPPAERRGAFIYLGALTFLVSLADPNGGLMDIPVSFFLKNKLHLEASEVARFRLIAGIPLYLSFVFGLLRDTWNPFGIKDRGLMAIFAAIGQSGRPVEGALSVQRCAGSVMTSRTASHMQWSKRNCSPREPMRFQMMCAIAVENRTSRIVPTARQPKSAAQAVTGKIAPIACMPTNRDAVIPLCISDACPRRGAGRNGGEMAGVGARLSVILHQRTRL